KVALGVSGVTALGIGISILAAPLAFYASYGIAFRDSTNLLNELRASAAGLSVLSIIMLIGIVREGICQTSIIAALTVFLAFPAGRILGLLVDGMPSASIVGALIFELVVAALLIIAFGRRATGKSSRPIAKLPA
ncbi:MAG: DUF4345 domain-containing protein, partial [Hyphomicrobiales bacterium]